MYNFNFKVTPIGSKDAETLILCSLNALTVAGAELDARVTTHTALADKT